MNEHKRRSPCCDDEAMRYLLSQHPDAYLFTVDSLAAALQREWRFGAGDTWKTKAAAIIQAAKERES